LQINPSNSRKFNLTGDDVNGPLNLEETILSAQTSEPEWIRNGSSFVDVEEVNGTYVKYSVEQIGSPDRFEISVQHVTPSSTTISQTDLKRHLEKVLGLRDNLRLFYEQFSSDRPLSLTFGPLRGLRLMQGTNLYESLICSILSQNNSARRWNDIARLLMKQYGKKVQFADKSSWFLFPRPKDIAELTVEELQRTTSMGYRARSVITVSRMIQDGELELDALVKSSYEDALESLLQLYGVGPKVADCFLLYGAGQSRAAPVDVWVHRIVNSLYLKGRRLPRSATASFLQDRFGYWAGYVQLYLFHYARRRRFGKADLPKDRHAS
jgi:N-glycosylase/DNA lyase